ncbi:MAG: SMP-30/gluconolactonase/LRE family protein [Gammaproteobacteria bacterium]|nr:SMP-30/gluconolactonase/LRE family protein [Gammaproteobacteria bacterium]
MKKAIGIFLIIVIGYLVISTLYFSGAFNNIEEHNQLSDVFIHKNMAGTEDLALINDKGLLFISSTDRWKLTEKKVIDSDGIYLLDLNSDKPPTLLQTNFQEEFHPHGISYLSQAGKDYIFAVNHNSKGDFVELFEFTNNALDHIKTFKNELMCCPNDLVAVDLNKFYVTNDHGSVKGSTMRIFEDYLRIAKSYVLYFDGKDYTKVYDKLNYANGIAISVDGKRLYITETTGRKLSVLDRNVESGKLDLRSVIQTDTGLDNITIDIDGNLWIASHPKLLDFVAHSRNFVNISPSQVLKFTPKGNDEFNISEVFLNTGKKISGSSTAILYKDQLFIGVVFENRLLRGTYSH